MDRIMTKNHRAKKSVRSRMAETGESYSAARRATLTPDTSRFPEGLAFVPDRCANCMRPLPDEEDGLFCSPWCKESASSVRYFRRVHRDGRFRDPDVQEAVRTRLAFLAAGGYEALGRNLSPQTRDAVKARAGGLCQECGAPGTDIDHIEDSSPDLENLQLLCRACHNAKTAASFVPASPETRVVMARLFFDRVTPSTPQLFADSDDWATKWRQLKAERRHRLLDDLAELDVDTRGLTSRAELIEARDEALAEAHDVGYEWDGFDEEGTYAFDPEAASNFDAGYGPNSYFSRSMNRDD